MSPSDLIALVPNGSGWWSAQNIVESGLDPAEVAPACVRAWQEGVLDVLWSQYPQDDAERSLVTCIGYIRSVRVSGCPG